MSNMVDPILEDGNEAHNTNTFMTEAKAHDITGQHIVSNEASFLGGVDVSLLKGTDVKVINHGAEISQQYGVETTAQTSYFDSKFVQSKRVASVESKQRSMRGGTDISRYRNIPTKNIKFEKFIELIFRSKMPTFEIQQEIIKYVQALETSYTDAIRDLKLIIDREKGK